MAAAAVVVSHDQVFKQIQKTLPDSIASDNVDDLFAIVSGKLSDTVKVYVETAVRYYVVKELCCGREVDISRITSVAKLSIDLARKEACLPTLPILVLSDAFDSLTVKRCEELFSFVENNVTVWKEALFFGPCKNQVLRMCNDVLRRLSRSQNTVFCGRILLFLARFFPFSERSGLNLISEFNLENVTSFGAEAEAMETDEAGDAKPAVDRTLYTKFWSLQDFFRNPSQCYNVANMNKFSQYTNDVLAAFNSSKLEAPALPPRSGPLTYDITQSQQDLDLTLIDDLPDANKQDQYFAKYLTNERLLELQFSDSHFRRYVLVQVLVLCHYLTSRTRFKLEREKLSRAQEDFVRSLEVKVFTLLRETPPDGDAFVQAIIRLLKREDTWSGWKNEGCRSVEKPAGGDEAAPVSRGRKRRLGEALRAADELGQHEMANAEMTRLWNLCPDNPAATKQARRDFTPGLEAYFGAAVAQVTGDHPGPGLVSDEAWGWRALRLLACRSPHFFTHSTAPIATLPAYLTNMVRRLARDMPQHVSKSQTAEDAIKLDDSKSEEEVKIISEHSGDTSEQPTEDDAAERPPMAALSEAEQKGLAAGLAKLPMDKWRQVTKKLGFAEDEVDYIMTQKGNAATAVLTHFLQLWVENEGEEANKEAILYTLGGLKCAEAANGVF